MVRLHPRWGHSALVTLTIDPTQAAGQAVPVPVRTIEQVGWQVLPTGWVHAAGAYDPDLGVMVDDGDNEF